jgi:signal transduction histidine kinase/ActR/RegA family two-component response regulator
MLGDRPQVKKNSVQQILTGVAIGAIGIAIMLNPWEFMSGVVFDTRSVLLSISGLFLGAVPTLLAVLITGCYRLYLSGTGAWTGVAVIATSGGVGLLWRHLRHNKESGITTRELYLFGITVHIAMLLWMSSLPWPVAKGVLSKISIPVLLIFPVTTTLLGWLMTNRESRKRAEDNLHKSGLTDIIKFLPYATLAIDKEKRIIIWNKAIEKMTGVPAAEMIGKGDYAYSIPFYGEARPQLMDLILMDHGDAAARYPNVVREDDSLTVEVFCNALYNNKGAWVSVKASPLHDHSGNIIGAIESIRDITERKRTEEALEKRLAALTSPLDQPDGIAFEELFDLAAIQRIQDEFAAATGVASIITQPDGAPITRPSNFCRLCEEIIRCTEKGRLNCYRSDAILGRHNPDGPIIQPCLSGGLWDAGVSITVGERHIANWLIGQVRDVTQSEEKMLEYAHIIGADEAAVLDAFREVPAMSHARFTQVAQALFTLASQLSTSAYQNIQQARFITERKRAEEEKAKLEGQIQRAQKMESIGSLAGGIAHDLNNILFPISGLSEMLLDDMPPDTPEYKSIEQIHKSAKRGSDLVKQILSFSRQSNPQKLPIRIQPILKEALKLAQATIPRNIEVKNHISTDCGMVSADPTQIHQIAMNLITNAFHAVEQTGGTIDIALKETAICPFSEKDELSLNAIPGDILVGGYACITVSDTGTGIDQTLIDKIFDPYFTTKELGKGTGLGLSVVHGIVKEHGGDIRVYSEVGKGTAFNVYLPLLEDNGDIKTAAVIKQYPTGHERILLVDDEEPIVLLEQMMLEKLGYQVTVRTSSPDALAAFKANPGNFDLVISDRGMPNMTGDQLAGELISIRPEIPVIICTGFCDENDEKRSMDLGVKGFLKKPVATGDLAEMVRKVLAMAMTV